VSSELGMNRDGKSKGQLKFSFKFGEVTQSSVAATTTTPPQQPSIGDKLAKGINKWLCGFAKMAVCHAVLILLPIIQIEIEILEVYICIKEFGNKLVCSQVVIIYYVIKYKSMILLVVT
jgi:hypothetical protein